MLLGCLALRGCLCTLLSAFQSGSDSGMYGVLDALSSTQLIVNETLRMAVSIILY